MKQYLALLCAVSLLGLVACAVPETVQPTRQPGATVAAPTPTPCATVAPAGASSAGAATTGPAGQTTPGPGAQATLSPAALATREALTGRTGSGPTVPAGQAALPLCPTPTIAPTAKP